MVARCLLAAVVCLAGSALSAEVTTQSVPAQTASQDAAVGNVFSNAGVQFVGTENGFPCLLANLNISLSISYKVPSGIPHETYDKVVSLDMPTHPDFRATCGQNVSTLALEWMTGALQLNLTFEVQSVVHNRNVTLYWVASRIDLAYETSNQSVFPGAAYKRHEHLMRNHLNLFRTPVGNSFLCDVDQKVLMSSTQRDRAASIRFCSVHIQPFEVTSLTFANATECSGDFEVNLMKKEEYFVPIIVAVCLLVIVLIVIAAYAVSRRMDALNAQRAYKPMD